MTAVSGRSPAVWCTDTDANSTALVLQSLVALGEAQLLKRRRERRRWMRSGAVGRRKRRL